MLSVKPVFISHWHIHFPSMLIPLWTNNDSITDYQPIVLIFYFMTNIDV